MRKIVKLLLALTYLCITMSPLSQAGLVHHRFRNVQLESLPSSGDAAKNDVASNLRKDQIPVTIVQETEPVVRALPKEQSLDDKTELSLSETQSDLLTTPLATADLAEETSATTADEGLNLLDDSVLADKNIIEETNELKLITTEEALIGDEQKQEAIETTLQEEQNANRLKDGTQNLKSEESDAQKETNETPTEEGASENSLKQAQQNLKSELDAETDNNDILNEQQTSVEQKIKALPDDVQEGVSSTDVETEAKQATQATPTQTSTQQNFVQQLIQNSPLGQFISQFTGGQQSQQQQQQQQPAQQLSDEPAPTPAPTLPGFLNPQNAITSAQQAIQNFQQQLQNSTSQAFQGVQQFASNLGSQFQSTLSNLVNQQQQQNQLSTSDSTTIRPPGPFQAIVSNFVGNNPNQGADGASTAAPGPLQGIFNLFQGNRPSSTTTAPASDSQSLNNNEAAVNDKLEVQQTEEVQQELDSEKQDIKPVSDTDLSFEEVRPDELIEVNDDPDQDVAV